MAQVKVRFNAAGMAELSKVDITAWMIRDILIPARREAVFLAHRKSGFMRASITHRIENVGLANDGVLEAFANYAIWQETEPGDVIPGVGTRKRKGGKPFLRPALFGQIKRILG